MRKILSGILVGSLLGSLVLYGQAGQIERSLSTITSPTIVGTAKFADGTSAAPSITFTSDTNLGMFITGANGRLGFADGGTVGMAWGGTALILNSTGSINFGDSTNASTASVDTRLFRDAANTLAQRNGTNAQAFRVYNTISGSDFEFASLRWSGNVAYLTTDANGTGVSRIMAVGTLGNNNLRFVTNNVSRWDIHADGHFIALADNTYDIGASGATRPRNIYAGSSIFAGSASSVGWASRSGISSPSDGVLTVANAAFTDFSRLQFGGTTSSFPSIQRSGTEIRFRLADDSNYTDIRALTFFSSGGVYSMTNVGTLSGSVDGVFLLRNSAGSDFGRLQFGGTTSSFPSLKRNGATLQFRLADDSAYTGFVSGNAQITEHLFLNSRFTATVDSATTFAATGAYMILACTGAETINTITTSVGAAGTVLVIENSDTECTIADDDSPTASNAVDLTGSANDVGAVGKVITLIYNGTHWLQVTESDN